MNKDFLKAPGGKGLKCCRNDRIAFFPGTAERPAGSLQSRNYTDQIYFDGPLF